jgi:hypothetical protein
MEKPMLNASQLMLPLQAQQLARSYNGRMLVHVEITVKQTVDAQPDDGARLPAAPNQVVQQFAADIHDMCMGEIPILVGSSLCHRPAGAQACYFEQATRLRRRPARIVLLGTPATGSPQKKRAGVGQNSTG